jgi:hypothetical protein
MDVFLGDQVVIVLGIGPKVRELKPSRERWIFKCDKNPYHDFLWRSKAVGPIVVRFYDMLKIPAEYDRDTSPAKLPDISRHVSPCFVTG